MFKKFKIKDLKRNVPVEGALLWTENAPEKNVPIFFLFSEHSDPPWKETDFDLALKKRSWSTWTI